MGFFLYSSPKLINRISFTVIFSQEQQLGAELHLLARMMISNQENQQSKHHKRRFFSSLSIYLKNCGWKYKEYIQIYAISRASITHTDSPYHYQYVWDIVAENNSNIYTSAIEKVSRANITNPGSPHHYLYVFGIMLLKISAIDMNISNQENRQWGKSAEQVAQTPPLLIT